MIEKMKEVSTGFYFVFFSLVSYLDIRYYLHESKTDFVHWTSHMFLVFYLPGSIGFMLMIK